MRIAVVTPLFPIAGEPQRGIFIYQTVRELARLAEVRVFCPVAVYPRGKWLRPTSYRYVRPDAGFAPQGVETTYFEYPTVPVIARPLNGRSSAIKLAPLLDEFRPDIVLAYWVYPEGRGAVLAARGIGAPVILGARGSDVRRPPDPWSFRLMRRTLRQADAVITVSEELRQRCIALGVPAAHVHTIPNGCDAAIFRPHGKSLMRAELGLSQDAEIVLFVGRLVPVKGISDLLEAVKRLAERRPRLQAALVGDGPLRAHVEALVNQFGLEGRVRLPGVRPIQEIAQWMAACDVLCLPSRSEGCPNVVLEAMACGRPVVASAVGGVPELVAPECGILVPPADPARLAAALDEALDRQWDETAIARRAQRGWDQVAAETFEICRRVLNRSRRAG